MLIEPVSGGATKTQVSFQLMNTFDIGELEVLDYEPVSTLSTVMKALNGVIAYDPEQEEA